MTSPPIGTDKELIVRLRKYGHIEAADALLSRIAEVERLREAIDWARDFDPHLADQIIERAALSQV